MSANRKKILDEYFGFTKGNQLAIIGILLLSTLSFFAPRFFAPPVNKKISPVDTAWIAAVKRLEIKDSVSGNDSFDQDNTFTYQYDRSENSYERTLAPNMFYFDPNTASGEDWKKLGLKDRTIKMTQNYLSKGGRFKAPEDLKKIYGLHNDEYERLAPFIRISETNNFPKAENYTKSEYSNKKPAYSSIDINLADTSAFISLPGIGSKLAARIVSFREKLGGFYSIDQIKETYGLPDSTFQKIKPWLQVNAGAIRKININTATTDELKNHPYIKWNLANVIVNYRNEHGLFKSVEALKNIHGIELIHLEKMMPYLYMER